MSSSGYPRPEVRWPLYVTAWCFIAAVYAVKSGTTWIVLCAVMQVLACWGLYAIGEPLRRKQ